MCVYGCEMFISLVYFELTEKVAVEAGLPPNPIHLNLDCLSPGFLKDPYLARTVPSNFVTVREEKSRAAGE